AAQAATAAIQGLAAGNLGQAAVGASAPYIAGVIKESTGDNLEARIMAHALLGAVLAKSQQNSAVAGAAGASIGELVASQLYPGKSADQLTEAEKQKVSALSTLAGGLVGGLAGGDSADALAGAGAAKNAVENNQLRGAEDLTLLMKQRQFAESCSGVSSSSCDKLSKDINELLVKASSVLKETEAVADDFLKTPASTTEPGQLVKCATSGNGVCVVSSNTIKTNLGQEWALEPASYEQSEIYNAKSATELATAKATLSETSKELFAAGCGGIGPAGIGCQLYMAGGGSNPVSGDQATSSERVMYGAQALLNGLGLFGAVYDGAAVGVRVGQVDGTVGPKATATPRTPLAGPTENWKTFVNAEKQIQLEAGAGQRVDQVINETLSGKKNFTSSMTLTTDEALSAGQKYLGPEYREIGKPGSGVFHSADGTKEFRIDSGSISGAHAPGVPHVHFGIKDPVTGKYISNNHVPYAD
ncbi:VENN motif pre-toxin domain-containing protein, partial [Pseudomonas syringae group genomosp. 3]